MSAPAITPDGGVNVYTGVVTCSGCGSALHLACPNCGPGADYEVTPRKTRQTGGGREARTPGFSSKPCITCGKPVELTGKGRPHFKCVACRG